MKHTPILLLTALLLSSCGMKSNPVSDDFATSLSAQVGCPAYRSQLWDGLYKISQEASEIPPAEDVQKSVSKVLISAHPHATSKDVDALATLISETYQLIMSPPPGLLKTQARTERTALLAALELGDRSTPERRELQNKIHSKLESTQVVAQALSPNCTSQDAPSSTASAPVTKSPLLAQLQMTLAAPVYGARKTLGTAYQSCRALTQSPLTSATPDVAGITRLAEDHPAGGGRRIIGNLKALLKSHPYLSSYQAPNAKTCFAVTKSPLIYDFGGKPYGTSQAGSELNLFRDFGDGTDVLGIDCSGFVATSLFAVGIKLRSDIPLRPVHASGVSTSMMMDPDENGLDCLEDVTFSRAATLLPGDVITIQGHTVMVDSIGTDPFGIGRITRAADCKVANIDTDNFNFVVVQSSSSKGGIGINRMIASDYLSNGGTMAQGLREVATVACRARLGETLPVPARQVRLSRPSARPACRTSAVPLSYESCLNSCSAPQ